MKLACIYKTDKFWNLAWFECIVSTKTSSRAGFLRPVRDADKHGACGPPGRWARGRREGGRKAWRRQRRAAAAEGTGSLRGSNAGSGRKAKWPPSKMSPVTLPSQTNSSLLACEFDLSELTNVLLMSSEEEHIY